MKNSSIKEELIKSKVKDNLSEMFDCVSWRSHSGRSDLDVLTDMKKSYGFVYICCESMAGLDILHNGIIVCRLEGKMSDIVPLQFNQYDTLSILGDAENLVVKLKGARFDYYANNIILPKSKRFVERSGDVLKLYSYTTINDIVNVNMAETEVFNNVICINEFSFNDTNYIANIVDNDIKYLCTSIDNYTQQILLDFDTKDVEILCGMSDEMLRLVYLSGDSICYRVVSDNGAVSSAYNIMKSNNCPTKILRVCGDNYQKCFCVEYMNGYISLFVYSQDKFKELYYFKGNNTKIFIYQNKLYLISKQGYNSLLKVFSHDVDFGNIALIKNTSISNADVIGVMDGCLLLTYNNCKRVVNLDSI